MNPVRKLWTRLSPDVQMLIGCVRHCFETHPPSSSWNDTQRTEALQLLDQLEQAWGLEQVDLEVLWSLQAVITRLDMGATVQCRAALEAVHGHLSQILEVTYEEIRKVSAPWGERPPARTPTPEGMV